MQARQTLLEDDGQLSPRPGLAQDLLAGLGGVMIAARLFAANGLQVGQAYELDAIAAVILGGTSFVGGIGSIWGTLIGALIIAVLTNGLVLLGV